MARPQKIPLLRSNFNPAPVKKRSSAEILAEIARVDTAIDQVAAGLPVDGSNWHALGQISVPLALRSLRHYRQRLCVGCNRTQDDVSLMFAIRKGGMPTLICSDCVEALHAIVVSGAQDETPAEAAE